MSALMRTLDNRWVQRPRPWRLFRGPHLIEILQALVEAIDEARVAARRAPQTDEARAEMAGLAALLCEPETAKALTRESAAELLDTVERAVIRLSDDAYVAAAARPELDGRYLRPPRTSRGKRAWLIEKQKRDAADKRRHWTRLRLKRRLMWRFAAGMTVAVLAAAAAARWAGAEWSQVAVALAAGALGSAVSGLLKLRDQLTKSTDIVAFAAIGSAQIAVGAAGGLLVLFLVKLGVLGQQTDNEWASIGALAFAAGFSEPFLLGTVRGIVQAAPQVSKRDQPDAPPGRDLHMRSVSHEPQDEFFRANVGIVVMGPAGRVLALERFGYPGTYQMPQGGLELGEEPIDAARRELEEETGLSWDQVRLRGEYPDWLVYELDPDDRSEDIGRGQAQKWFYVELRDTEAPIELEQIDERKGTHEFTDSEWMSFDELISKAVPFRRPVYERVAEYARTL
jgi:putative (di)nucleoside polyphosphate hydrolase